MSMHKLTAGDGYRYLTRHVAAGDAGLGAGDSLTGYYEQSGNPPGRWYGHGLAGLDAESIARLVPGDLVSEEAMAAVFGHGTDPLTGAPLGRPYPRYDKTADAVPGSPETPGRHAVVGYDLTFTAPKSVSVLWALGDDATRAQVHGAHRAALTSALEFVEAKVVRTRVGAAGCRQVHAKGMIAAAFEHWDTRTTDPNLHTHVVVANKVQGPDGLWRALDGTTVHRAVVTVSELYDVMLADELARRLPVSWGMRERGERRIPRLRGRRHRRRPARRVLHPGRGPAGARFELGGPVVFGAVDLVGPGGELGEQAVADAVDLEGGVAPLPALAHAPRHGQPAGELVGEHHVVQLGNRHHGAVDGRAVQGPPQPVGSLDLVRHHDVGVQVRVGGAGVPVLERGGDHALGVNLAAPG